MGTLFVIVGLAIDYQPLRFAGSPICTSCLLFQLLVWNRRVGCDEWQGVKGPWGCGGWRWIENPEWGQPHLLPRFLPRSLPPRALARPAAPVAGG